MSEEIFDVVDEDDVVLRQLPRSRVHAEKLIHRATHIFVFRSDGRLLIHKRTADKEEFPGVWTSSASGHVAAGESYDDTAPRELFEELGLQSELTRLHKFAPCEETCREHTVLYETVCDEVARVDSTEIAAIDELSIGDLKHRIGQAPNEFSPAFRLLFGWYCENRLS